MPVAGDVGLEVHLVVLRVHHGERVVLVLVVTEPRAVGKLREEHYAARAVLRASVAVFLLYQGIIRAKDVGEVLVVLALGKLLNLDMGPCPPHRSLFIRCWRPRVGTLAATTVIAGGRRHDVDVGLRVLGLEFRWWHQLRIVLSEVQKISKRVGQTKGSSICFLRGRWKASGESVPRTAFAALRRAYFSMLTFLMGRLAFLLNRLSASGKKSEKSSMDCSR